MPCRAADCVKPQQKDRFESSEVKIQEVQLMKPLQVSQQFKIK